MAKRKWYVVTVGKSVGVFRTWIEVSPLVTGVSGALHQSFAEQEEAVESFNQERLKGNVRVVGDQRDAGQEHDHTYPRTPLRTAGATVRAPAAGRSAQAPPLNPPVTAVEVNDPPLSSPSSSPPTGITQVVSLSPSSVLSPLDLREDGLEPEVLSAPAQRVISIHASSSSPGSSGRGATSTVQLSSSDNSLPPVTINIMPVQHVHCARHADQQNVDALTSGFATLGLSQVEHVPRGADPRSPVTRQGLASASPHPTPSRRPSPRSQLFSG
ncbi:hypothetical protein DFH07DRAFT_806089 [Mycena maculata]|uniref:Ribonuclease H1 N-terminal domain-containing protein n=1 Tax=Mycena maculata TaxID=230809 RepID=A0AAD7NQJ7_9AGAR|nr:hypothetical protein DFH07DRAFT_806089 [Mycena maculata]